MIDTFTKEGDYSSHDYFMMDRGIAIKNGVTDPKKQPYFKDMKSKVGVLLIHGYTATPENYIPLCKAIEEKGYTVYASLVAGHGLDENYLNTASYVDWYNSIKYGYLAISEACEKVIVIGESAGALLTLLVANYNRVDKVMLFSPAFRTKNKYFPFLKYLHFLNLKIHVQSEHKYKHEHEVRCTTFRSLNQLRLIQEVVQNLDINYSYDLICVVGDEDVMVSVKAVDEYFNKHFSKECGDHKYSLLHLANDIYEIDHVIIERDHSKTIQEVVAMI